VELIFLALLLILLALALGSGYPVAFALPGAAILTIAIAAACGFIFAGGNVDAYFAQGGPSQWLSAGVTNLRGIYWEVERDTLIAIPLFIFMGIMLQRSKIAEDLLLTMAQLFGPVPGGLGISVVFVGALLAATTGIVGATVVAMGLISLPVMLRNNYSPSLATGTIAASGTLGQIIPPSIVLIILADQLASATDQASTARKAMFKDSTGELTMPSEFDVGSTSAGEMFLGAFVPGLVLVALYMLYILFFAILRPKSAPAVRKEGGYDRAFLGQVLATLVPPLTLIFLVLGSIISGIATVNQAGAIGAAGALLMAGYRLKQGSRGQYLPAILGALSLIAIAVILMMFDNNVKDIKTDHDRLGITLSIIAVAGLLISLLWSGIRVMRIDNTLYEVMIETAKTTSLVFIILLGAAILTAAFRAFGGEELVRDYLNALPGGFWTKFIIVMAVIFVLGFFLDFIEIAVVVVPIVAPILLADPSANITAVWLGVMIGLNIQTSFLTPPFGFALFYMRGVAPAAVKTIQMYKGVIAFIILQLIALGIVGYYPQLVNYLPKRLQLTAETAPPPRNPKLQHCVEQFITEEFANNGGDIRSAIDRARSLNFDILPDKLAKSVKASFDEAEKTFGLLEQSNQAADTIDQASGDFRPIHRQVRDIRTAAAQYDREVTELETELRRLPDNASDETRSAIQAHIDELIQAKADIEATTPDNWEEVRAGFTELQSNERKLRREYRQAADKGYSAIAELQETLAGTEALQALDSEIAKLVDHVESNPPEASIDLLADASKLFGDVRGASKIKSEISRARKALRSKKPSVEKALTALAKAQNEYDEQMVWRAQAAAELAQPVAEYESAIRSTIGVRQQSKLTRDQALYVASCDAGHRDISLNF
jgi:tripartite ATP-independent transporter DctM subunit